MTNPAQKIKIKFHPMTDFFSQPRKFLAAVFALVVLISFSCAVFAQEDDEENQAQDAAAIFNKGQDAHEKGDLETAIKFYDEAIKLAPEFPEAEFQRGSAFLSLNKPAEAEKSFRRAIALREDWTLPMVSLGSILISTNRLDEAEKILTKSIELNENNFPAYIALTDLRLKTKASSEILKELLKKFQTLTAKANPTASLWASRAALERALGDKAAAKTSLKNALAAEPNNKQALIERAEIARSEGDFATAIEVSDALAGQSPESADIKLLQARIYAEAGRLGDAVKILNSIKKPPAEAASLRNSILAAGSENVADLEKQLESDQKNPVVLGRLCGLLRQSNPPKALDYCRRASEADPDNINHAVGFGAALVQAKQYENAVTIMRRILKIAPDNFTARANLATALFQLKRFAEAKAEYQILIEKNPELPAAYYFLAIIHDNLEEYLDAMANYQQFLKVADAEEFKLEIEKVKLRLPTLQKQIKEKKGRK